jgi:uncharacterized protein YkwD
VTATRRGVLAVGVASLATPALADVVTNAAPSAADTEAWSGYEARLRERFADAGGGRLDEDVGRAVLDLTNRARAEAGAGALAWHAELAATARAHAGDLAAREYVEHLSPEGFDPSHRFWLIGRATVGSPSENIAYHRGGQAAPARLFQRWRQSVGHWRNLLRPTHTHAAYAWVTRGDRTWLVGLYARPLASLPEPLPFRARGPEIGRALRSLPSENRPRLGVPQGSRLGKVDGRPPVMQITALRAARESYEVVGGPIFLAADLAGS